MIGVQKYGRWLGVMSVLVISVFLLTKCISNGKDKEQQSTGEGPVGRQVSFTQFTGSAVCAGCHQDIYEKHLKTGHFLTSQPALEEYIRGHFEPGKNEFVYSPLTKVVMEKRDSGFYQVVYQAGREKMGVRFDIVTGSGAKGQSYLYWSKNRLFQMPVTYYTIADQWANSPGFPHKVVLNRPITSRCLECHTTYAELVSEPGKEPEEFDSNKMLFGVDCEKCHGPAAGHVEFHTANPGEKQARQIINPASLTRQQNLDLCGMCHGGALKKTKPSFEFMVGDSLADFFELKDLSNATPTFDNIDVHGNQLGLLKASKCFTQSNMTCNSCHSSHENERGNTKLFSQRCMNCHKPEHDNFCKMAPNLGASITSNCIDCHMPSQRSRAITLDLPGSEVPVAAFVRSHFISVYPDEVRKFLNEKK